MNISEYRSGLDERYVVTRRLKLEHIGSALIGPIVTDIDSLTAVDRVSINADTRVLNLVYDSSVSDQVLADVENVLQRYGCNISNSRWIRLKRSWYRFTDKNIYENSKHQTACCNKPPPGK